MARSSLIGLKPTYQVYWTLVLVVVVLHLASEPSNSQIVSSQLRKLAVSTNQFGIDVLKALDKIESPNKVIVFCPICISSPLAMVMMGSSRQHVVSSLRQALYVWSMKPQDINQAYKDIFEHIGLNQFKTTKPLKYNSTNKSAKLSRRSTVRDQNVSTANQVYSSQSTSHTNPSAAIEVSMHNLSLPQLMIFKELSEARSKSFNEFSTRSFVGPPLKSGNRATSIRLASGENRLTVQDRSESGRQVLNDNDVSRMSATSNVYAQRGLPFDYNYNLLLNKYFKTVTHPVDFLRNKEETRQHINSIVSANTEGKVKDLVKWDSNDSFSTPNVLIITTFHFRGTLDIHIKGKMLDSPSSRQSQSSETDNRTRTVSNPAYGIDPTFIETECSLLKYGHFPKIGCSMVEVPFNNRLVSLVVVMADDRNSTELLLTKLSARVLNDMLSSLTINRVSIKIPVIKFDRGPINTVGLLRELSLDSLFLGNRPQTPETGLNHWLRPSDIIHETSIDIGTINPNWLQTEDRLKIGAHDSKARQMDSKQLRTKASDCKHVRLDRPFFYFVLDSINGLVLTMGRIRQ